MELADMQDLGSCGRPCGFKSHIPHFKNQKIKKIKKRLAFYVKW